MRYTKINEGVEAKVEDGYLYVRLTAIRLGMLVQGERAGRIYRMPYGGTIDQVIQQEQESDGPTVIDRAMDPNYGQVIRAGRLIH